MLAGASQADAAVRGCVVQSPLEGANGAPIREGYMLRVLNLRRTIMSFSINTNVASLQAQNYLSINSAFQDKTIQRVTSGLRIVNSGDDAAGWPSPTATVRTRPC